MMNTKQIVEFMLKQANDPASDLYYTDSRRGLVRRSGAAHRNAFWLGFDGTPRKYQRTSWSEAAYKAGRLFAKNPPEWVPADSTIERMAYASNGRLA